MTKKVEENLPDDALLSLIKDGNGDAFNVLVERHNVRFYRLAYRYMGRREDAEDIVQDAFIKLWEQPDLWDSTKGVRFTTWFYRVIVNRCLDRKKSKQPLQMPEWFDVAEDKPGTDDAVIRSEQQILLEQAIAELPPRQQTALNLCFYEDVSNREAADIMQIDLPALQSLLMRAKTTLKQKFQGKKENEDSRLKRGTYA